MATPVFRLHPLSGDKVGHRARFCLPSSLARINLCMSREYSQNDVHIVWVRERAESGRREGALGRELLCFVSTVETPKESTP